MILYTGEPVHEVVKPGSCWGDGPSPDGECNEPATINGLCGSCYVRLTGERPMVKVYSTAPPSESSMTGCGRR